MRSRSLDNSVVSAVLAGKQQQQRLSAAHLLLTAVVYSPKLVNTVAAAFPTLVCLGEGTALGAKLTVGCQRQH